MRIGLFSDTYMPEINGVVTSIVTLQKELEKHGHTVFVVTTAPSALHVQKDGNILRLPGIEIKKLYGYRMSSPFSVVGLNDIATMHLDIIHVHTEFGIGTFARIVSKLLSIPIVATYHTLYEDYTHYLNFVQSATIDKTLRSLAGSLSKAYGTMCHELIAPSEKTRDILKGYGVEKEIHVIPTGLELSKFSRANFDSNQLQQLRTSLGIQEHEKVLLFVGRIAVEKAIDMILQSMQILVTRKVPVKAVIVGGGPYLDELKYLAKKLDLVDHVVFTDKKPNSEVPMYYAMSDMFVSASTSETQGLTFIEAIASESVVFAKERNILSDIIIEGESGYYFDDSNELARKIEEHISLPSQKQQQIVKKGLEMIQPLGSQPFYEAVYKVYLNAISKQKDEYAIVKIKMKQSNYFEVTLESAEEELALMISIESFYKYELEKGACVQREIVEEFKKEDSTIRSYLGAIRYLTVKDRTRKEMYDYLSQKTPLTIKEINQMIEQLENMGYIDDDRYLQQSLESMKASLMGKKKIKASLVKKGIPYEKIDAVLLQEDDEDFVESAIKLIEQSKLMELNKNLTKTKEAIQSKLLRMGYNNDIIAEVMQRLHLEKDEEKESVLLSKEYDKQLIRLSKKYTGFDLKSKLITTLIRKGFEYAQVIEEVESRKDEFETN
ncbi:MAG: RecX family transcriptional regulator [Erysipelotrichales bacterium]|nr:RecX family transcriptional regulator [Erysipelotrichales bacterium]